MPKAGKDTLYIDAEDEITAVIEKVVDSKEKIVAVVLPKHAAVLQSPVNVKLLKKAATAAKKNIVLVTSDKAIMSVAAVAGVHVAKTPTSKPIIPPPKHATVDKDVSDNEATADVDTEELIELDNTEEAAVPAAKAATKKKGLKVPDFSSFKLKLGLAIAAVLVLIVTWVFGFVVLPKATITIETDVMTTSVNTKVTTRLGETTELDLEDNILPAERVQVEKINKLTVDATGEKNIGSKAVGIMTLTNCIKSDGSQVVAAGTRFSAGAVTFETAENIILPASVYNFDGTECRSAAFGLSRDVDVIAIEPGSSFNVSEQTYTSSISGIQAYGSDMAGGTTDNVKVISQEDVDLAAQELSGTSKTESLNELRQELQEKGLLAIEETLGEGTPRVLATPAVGEEADSVEVTVTITYNLTGVSEQDLAAILDNEIQKNIGDESQNIRDNGLSAVTFSLSEKPNEAENILIMQTVATVGPELDAETLKQELAGKTRGDIEKQLESIEGVKSVVVEYSPAWITTTPKSADKLVIIFNESDGQ